MKYAKTEAGQQAFKDRSPALTPRARSAFIQFDGQKTVAQVLAATSGLGITMDDVDRMVELGFLVLVAGAAPASAASSNGAAAAAPAAPAAIPSSASPMERFQKAYPIASKLTGSMGLRGFRLNLAVEGAGNYEQLLDLFPKIRDAVGAEKAVDLERALKGE